MTIVKKNSKEIQQLLKKGHSQYQIVKKGYSKSTVRYWHRKMYRHEVFEKMITKIKNHQKKKYAERKSNSNH